MLLEWEISSLNVIGFPLGEVSCITALPKFMLPLPSCTISFGEKSFSSTAADAVTILKVEPGSYMSVIALFRHPPATYLSGVLGLTLGLPAMASIAPE